MIVRNVLCALTLINGSNSFQFPTLQLFLRGKPHLQKYMRRLPKTHKKLPMKKKDEPDFYKLDQSNPLPEVHEAPVPGAAATVQAMRNGPITPTNSGLSPMSHPGGNNDSSIVTPHMSPNHAQTFIGGPGISQHNNMMGNHGMNGYNTMGGSPQQHNGANIMSNSNFMNAGMNGMMNVGFSQGSMGMMGGHGHGNGSMNTMMGGMSSGSGMGGGAMSMGPRDGNSGSSMDNTRFSQFNDMGSHEEFDTTPIMGGQPQSFAPMNHMNGGGSSNSYGNSAGYGQQSYSSNPSSPTATSMRRAMPTGKSQQNGGMETQFQHMQSQESDPVRTPQYQQQYMSDMYMSPPMQDMMQPHHLGMYGGGRSMSGGGPMGSTNNGLQDDFRSSSPNPVQEQQQRLESSRATS